MPDDKKLAQQPKAAAPPPSLAPASESGDPAVHQILAERQTAAMNGDEDAVKAADEKLADLGFK